MKFLEIFQENNGRLSHIRVMSTLWGLAGIGYAFGTTVDYWILLIFALAAFAPKVLQKMVEVKGEVK